MLKQLPSTVEAALASGPVAVMRAARDLGDAELGIAVLWILHTEAEDREPGRVLAIECGRVPDSGIARACRLWLMFHDANDLGIAHTLVSFLHRALAEGNGWPGYLIGAVLHFTNAILSHAEPSLRAQGLSLLAMAAHRGRLPDVLHAEGASALADTLKRAVASLDLDEEELEDLALVADGLSANLRQSPALDPRALQRVVLDVLDTVDRLAAAVDGLSGLVGFVKERALLDDAGARAARQGRPLQTLRVVAAETTTRLINALVAFAEAVVSSTRDPEFAEFDAPDYGLRVAWAPAASVPIHLSYCDDDARVVFETLEQLLASNGRDFDAAIADVSPNVAASFVRLVERLRQHDDQIEIVLTDPGSQVWQRHLTLGPEMLRRETISALMRRTRSAARDRSVNVAREDVPQANTVRQVFQAVDAMLAHGVVTHEDIDEINSKRQVNYYKHGARVLGFFDEDNQPTGRARSLIGRSHDERLAITAVYFEDSPIGRAWRTWAGADHLYDIDPNTAQTFLEGCVHDLTNTTPGRRASTLRAWFAELKPHYPMRQS